MLLANKHAIVYGAGGSLGGAVAIALAAAGAAVYLTGRNGTSVQAIAEKITKAAGKADVDVVDGYDEKAINDHIQKIGWVDISFNAVGVDVKQGAPLIDFSMDEYVVPITKTMQTRFLTAKAAGRRMIQQGSGVILS